MSIAEIFDSMSYTESPESDKSALAWIEKHHAEFGHFINGAFTSHRKKGAIQAFSPATGQKLAKITQGNKSEVDSAVEAARSAQIEWAACGGFERAKYLYALSRAIQRNSRLISVLESLDNGKPIRESRDIDVPLAARHFLHHAGWSQLTESEFSDHQPIGVVGQVIPWNFPFLMLAWKIAPALAMGNAVVLKPAEFTSLSALLFAELAQSVGLPPGVLNIVTGDGETGSLIVEHQGVQKVAFTGSTAVGKRIREVTAGSGKSLTLELGGKSPFIVFDDADLDAAVEGVVDAIWFNQGQVCCAGSRILVQEGVASEFHSRLRTRMTKLRVGNSLDKCIDMSSLVAPVQLERVSKLVDVGVASGATLFQPDIELPSEGCFYPPTLLSDVQPTSIVATEEIFGPVVVSMTFRTYDEGIELANNSRYGLAASIWSESINQSLDVAAELEAGVIWVNTTNALDAAVGFGGKRESGFGREGGREGCFAYLKPRAWADLPIRKSTQTIATEFKLDIADIDRSPKQFIGGKQVRPDSGYSRRIFSPNGALLGQVGEGNRKDIRDAVEAARKSRSWSQKTAHNRSQILYYIAENLSARHSEFATRIHSMVGGSRKKAELEVQTTIKRLFYYAGWSDKYEGAIHMPPIKGVALSVPEAFGVTGVICPNEAPLLGLVSVVAPLLATGNRVVAVPSEHHPLIATDLYQVLETSDLPAGALNIVTGTSHDLAEVLSRHNDVDAVWAFGDEALSLLVEKSSIGNLKRTFVDYGRQFDWSDSSQGEGQIYLQRATEAKNIWIPYGE